MGCAQQCEVFGVSNQLWQPNALAATIAIARLIFLDSGRFGAELAA